MKCYICDSELIWGGDHSYEDYCLDGDGIVTNLSCSNSDCDVESVLVYRKFDDDQEDEKPKSEEKQFE